MSDEAASTDVDVKVEEKAAEEKAQKAASSNWTGVGSKHSSFIWDVNSPNEPDFEIKPPSPLCCLVFNPRSSDQLCGGCYRIQWAFWLSRCRDLWCRHWIFRR